MQIIYKSLGSGDRFYKYKGIIYRIIKPDGTVRWMRGKGNVLHDATGKAVRMMGTVLDISDRKQIEQQLQSSQEFLNNIIDGIPDPIIVKDKQHKWVVVNKSFCNMLGHDREEMIGLSDYDFFPPQQAADF